MRDTCGLLIAGQGAARGDRRATGDKEVAAGQGRDTRFADVAMLSSGRRDTIEIVPERYGDRAPRQFCFGRGASREAVSTRRR
jgi:hypothetical protein